jgi:lipopolysaccharide export system protein LptC
MADTDPPRAPYHRTWILLVLLLVPAAISLLVLERRVAPLTGPPAMPQTEPDFVMEAPRISQFGPDGLLQYRLSAAEIRHFEDEALTRMLEPRLTLHRGDDPPWQVSARLGTLHRPDPGAGEDRVSLEEDVVVEHTLPAGERISLSTKALVLYPDRQYAETDQDVMIDSHIGRTTASGLKGDLRLGTISLQSTRDAPVHTVLQPQHFR